MVEDLGRPAVEDLVRLEAERERRVPVRDWLLDMLEARLLLEVARDGRLAARRRRLAAG